MFTIRRAAPGDAGFIAEMLVEAASWDPTTPRRSLDELLAVDELRHYVDGWPRPDDLSVVAIGENEGRIGAAWSRYFPAADPGYGFIDGSTPEVSVGVVASERGRGVGGALLDALAAGARERGVAALSLSVEHANPAVRLYERHGFVVFADTGGALTMRLELGDSSDD